MITRQRTPFFIIQWPLAAENRKTQRVDRESLAATQVENARLARLQQKVTIIIHFVYFVSRLYFVTNDFEKELTF